MRSCAKMRCGSEPVATVSLRYEAREVVVSPLVQRPDPSLVDLCREHAERMTPPMGWIRTDRLEGSLASR